LEFLPDECGHTLIVDRLQGGRACQAIFRHPKNDGFTAKRIIFLEPRLRFLGQRFELLDLFLVRSLSLMRMKTSLNASRSPLQDR